MNVGEILRVLRDVITLLEAEAILLPDGSFDRTKLDSVSEDVAFAIKVKDILKKHGLHVPENVEQIIQLVAVIIAGFLNRPSASVPPPSRPR